MEKVEQAKQLIMQAVELIGIFSVYSLITDEFNKRVAVKVMNLF